MGLLGGDYRGPDSTVYDARHATNIPESLEEHQAAKSQASQGFATFQRYVHEHVRHALGLHTETIDFYSPEALSTAHIDRTAWERVRDVFISDQDDYPSGESIMIGQAFFGGFLGGGVYGFYKETRGIKDRFIAYHQTTVFERPLDARAKLADTVMFHGWRGGLKYGVKVALLAGGFCTIVSVITALRNKSGIVEYTAGGFLMGALWRMNFGLSGAMTAGCLGAVLGTVGGTCAYGMTRFSGKTYEELAYWKKVRNINSIKKQLAISRKYIQEPELRMHEAFKKAALLGDVSTEEGATGPTEGGPAKQAEGGAPRSIEGGPAKQAEGGVSKQTEGGATRHTEGGATGPVSVARTTSPVTGGVTSPMTKQAVAAS